MKAKALKKKMNKKKKKTKKKKSKTSVLQLEQEKSEMCTTETRNTARDTTPPEASPLQTLPNKSSEKPGRGKIRLIEDLKMRLKLNDIQSSNSQDSILGTKLEKAENKQPEVIVFDDPAKKSKQNRKAAAVHVEVTDAEEDLIDNFAKVRHDVHQFGISGMEKEPKEAARVKLLLKLGAKPPKNKHYNYKEYMELQKQAKQKAAEQINSDKTLGYSVKPQQKAKQKRNRDDILTKIDLPFGKFDGGMLSLHKDELSKMKKSKLKHT